VSQLFLDHIQRDEEIDSVNIRLYFLSRNRSVLGLLAILVLALSAGIAWLVQAPKQNQKVNVPPMVELTELLASATPQADRVVHLMMSAGTALPADIDAHVLKSSLPPGEKLMASALSTSIFQCGGEASARLMILAHQPDPIYGANEAIAELLARDNKIDRAKEYFLRELNVKPEARLRDRLVSLLARHGDFVSLIALAGDPAFAPHFSAALRLKLALHQHQWVASAKALTEVETETLHFAPVFLALVAGIVWLVIAVQAGQPTSWFSYRTLMPILAVVVGCAASWPSHFIAAWQEQILGLRETGEFLPDLAFFIGNVAPREELIKLAFLFPFLPFLIIRRSALETLVVSGCVGLGFAIEGNLQTYQHAGAADAFGRLLTANFFHFATTGLLGLALCHFVFSPRRKCVAFLGTLLGVIAAHGVYDAFMNIAGIRALAAASMLSFFIVSQVVFHHLKRMRDQSTDQLFLAATLVISLTILAGATLVCAALEIGFQPAVNALAANMIGLALVVVVFFRQLGQKLSKINDGFLNPSAT
jgi:protease PrsW